MSSMLMLKVNGRWIPMRQSTEPTMDFELKDIENVVVINESAQKWPYIGAKCYFVTVNGCEVTVSDTVITTEMLENWTGNMFPDRESAVVTARQIVTILERSDMRE